MRGQLGLGHVRVVLVETLHDARRERRLEFGPKLAEKRRGRHEDEAIELSALTSRLELADQVPSKIVLPAVFVRISAVRLFAAMFAVEFVHQTPRVRGIVCLKDAGVTSISDDNPGVCHYPQYHDLPRPTRAFRSGRRIWAHDPSAPSSARSAYRGRHRSPGSSTAGALAGYPVEPDSPLNSAAL